MTSKKECHEKINAESGKCRFLAGGNCQKAARWQISSSTFLFILAMSTQEVDTYNRLQNHETAELSMIEEVTEASILTESEFPLWRIVKLTLRSAHILSFDSTSNH